MIRWRPLELFVWMWIQSNAIQYNQQLVRDNRIQSMIVNVLTHLDHGSTVRHHQSLRLVREGSLDAVIRVRYSFSIPWSINLPASPWRTLVMDLLAP